MSSYVAEPNFYKGFTFAIFQRSATEHHFKMMQHFKTQVQTKRKIPFIYEIDDMLIGIPEWNYAHQYYKKNEIHVKNIMEMADGMTVSTPTLKKIYSKFNNNIEVILNHLPKYIWGDVFPAHEYKDGSEKVKIMWPGSQNHFYVPQLHDKQGIKGGDFTPKFMDFIKKTANDYDWIFMGAMPQELKTFNKSSGKIKYIEWQNIFTYPRVMKSLEPDICIAPLQKGLFNSAKSNIKALEFVAVGAVGVYTNIDPYQNMTLKSDSDEEMISHIEKLASDIDLRTKVYKKDRTTLTPQLFWEENNNIKKFIDTHLSLFGQKLP